MIGIAAALLLSPDQKTSFERASRHLERAIRSNDAPALGMLLSPQWFIIDPDGRMIGRKRFLSAISAGELKHSQMRFSEARVRLFSSAAINAVRADGEGTFRDRRFTFSERSTDFWTRVGGRWVCVLTQLTRIAPISK